MKLVITGSPTFTVVFHFGPRWIVHIHLRKSLPAPNFSLSNLATNTKPFFVYFSYLPIMNRFLRSWRSGVSLTRYPSPATAEDTAANTNKTRRYRRVERLVTHFPSNMVARNLWRKKFYQTLVVARRLNFLLVAWHVKRLGEHCCYVTRVCIRYLSLVSKPLMVLGPCAFTLADVCVLHQHRYDRISYLANISLFFVLYYERIFSHLIESAISIDQLLFSPITFWLLFSASCYYKSCSRL